jgi:hypothetical protein
MINQHIMEEERIIFYLFGKNMQYFNGCTSKKAKTGATFTADML